MSKTHRAAPGNKFLTVPKDQRDALMATGRYQEVSPEDTVILHKPRRRLAGAMLADDFMDQRLCTMQHSVVADTNEELRSYLRTARKYVLDDEATRLASNLSCSSPEQVARMLEVAVPPANVTWIEMPSAVMLDARRRAKDTAGFTEAQEAYMDRRPADCRIGLLIIQDPGLHKDGNVWGLYAVEHGDTVAEHFTWPIGFMVATEGRPFLPDESHDLGPLTEEFMTAKVWGYHETAPALKVLNGRGFVIMPSTYSRTERTKELVDGIAATAMQELSGITRLAVACLAMLNAVPVIETEGRPPGSRLLKGGRTAPLYARSTVSLSIPRRVRAKEAFARRAIAAEVKRKKLHEVRPHFRHLTRKPAQDGWTQAIHPLTLQPCWRKKIDGHLRGDPELGVVEHRTTIVHGPKGALS